MSELIAQKAFEAIKKDDCSAFAELSKNDRIGAYRYGRFPALSLMYLYKSKKLLKLYEDELIKISDYVVVSEPVPAFSEFKKKAGKCLRLYFDETVSPLEMLLILDKTKRLKRVYPLTKPSQGVKQRLKSVYSIKYGLSIKFENDRVILDRRPLSYREKKRIATACVSVFLVAAICVGVPVTTVALIPKPVEGEATKLSQIDFSSKKEYTLKKDIVLPENYAIEKVNCKIDGNGKKLIFKKGATLGELNGKVENLTVETTGDMPVFTTVSETATVENLFVEVNADFASAESGAFVVGTNLGTVQNVTVTVSGKLNALAPSGEEASSFVFGGIVRENFYKYNAVSNTTLRGRVNNCSVTYQDFTLSGETGANAAFGGVAGLNYGYVDDCTVSGSITADTFDIAGVCVENYGQLSGDKNEASLFQTTEETGWNPISCGIVLNNANIVDDCRNSGSVTAKSECGQFEINEGEPTVSAAGIAYLSRGNSSSLIIKDCKNYGEVTASAEYRTAYAAGVCVSNNSGINGCLNKGRITATAGKGRDIYIGGISSVAYGYIVRSANDGEIGAEGNGKAYAGGIASLSIAQFLYCRSTGGISIEGEEVFVGGILGCGELANDFFGVYRAFVESSVSQSNIKAVKTGEGAAYVGGIVGYLREEGLQDSTGSTVYFSGSVTGSYFTGRVEADGYCGNIVGVCGINIYTDNKYTSNRVEYPYFDGNVYLSNSYTAFGAVFTEDKDFNSAEDKGAYSVTEEEIEADENYKKILAEISVG